MGSAKNPNTQPGITTPKGGGAIHGIGDQFQANSFTGAAGFSIPFPLTAARGFEPSLSVSYSSGSGNGVCGMGADLGISGISRKTSNGIPKYDDTDVFLLHGTELVPKQYFDAETRQWQPVVRQQGDWQVTTYLPRIEGSFDLIEHWQENNGGGNYWMVTSGGNQQQIYGISPSARVADPAKPWRIFSWMPEEEKDATGNLIQYRYELGEEDNHPYLKTVQYGNYIQDGKTCFAFMALVDYGTFNPEAPDDIPSGYVERPDPFSAFVSGFEIRNSRLVHNLLMYHQFPDQYNGTPFLVKLMALHYGATSGSEGNSEPLSGLSFLRSILLTGYAKQSDGSYLHESMPPLELTYTPFLPASQRYQSLQVEFAENIPGYLTAGSYQLIDLNNDGLPGFLYSNEVTSFYYEPLGEGRYAAPVVLEGFPSERDLGDAQNTLMSLSGNGVKDLVVENAGRSGYYKNSEPGEWNGFEPFHYQATEVFSDGRQWADLTGDGLADLVLFEQDAIKFYPSLRTEGYGAATRIALEDGFPATENDSEVELLTFADILGDGLQHYIRIRNGSLECWPSLGYGHFGKVRKLQNAPRIDAGMDARRLRLADIDGSGTADVIYLDHDHIKIWFNQSGNGFSEPIAIALPVNYDQLSQVDFADVNGTGTTCMIITVTEPEVHHWYYDFAGGEKPYLLAVSKNNMGASATYTYTTSVKQYLRDKREGRPWPTRLFFPVHVVSASEALDEPSGAYHIQRFAFHDGYYDPVERTFRGFGFTESWSTDHFEAYSASASNIGFPVNTINQELHVPPVYTKSWYHNGAYAAAGRTTVFYEQEYFNGDPAFYSISGQVLEKGIVDADAETLRQAYAAMEGQLLRQEVYGLDGSAVMQNPYTVTETEILIRLEQPREQERYAVFLPYVRQSLSWQYERNPADPRVTHTFSLMVDEWGAVTRSCAVYYPRRQAPGTFIFAEQQELKVTLAEGMFVSATQTGSYYISVPVESHSYEITGLDLPQTGYFSFDEIEEGINEALQRVVDYNTLPADPTTPFALLYGWEQQYYWDGTQADVLPLGSIGVPLLAHHSETAVYPADAFNQIYSGLLSADDIAADTGYIVHDGYYWNAGLSQYYLPATQYYLPVSQQNDFAPAGNISLQPAGSMTYDTYSLRPVMSTQQLTGTAGIITTAEIDYRTMQHWRVTDANENVSEAMFDPLGNVMVSTLYGTVKGKTEGYGPLSSYTFTRATATKVLEQPEQYLQNAGGYFYYDLFAWMDRHEPVCAIALQAQLYTSQVKHGQPNPIKTGIVFSDGFGRSLVSKTNTAPGSLGVHDRDGNWVYTSRPGEKDWSDDRWICTGRTIYNNIGSPAQQFQPYFSNGWQYEPVDTLISGKQIVPPSVIHYDALSRVIRTDEPKGFFSKLTFTPWESKHFDANDTILDSPYYLQHQGRIEKIKSKKPGAGDSLAQTEIDAIKQAIACYNSPAVSIYDTMGRAVRGVADNLGAVTANKLLAVLGDADAVQTALNELEAAGWLVADVNDPDVFWLTDAFQPYTAGFAAAFTIGGASAAALLNLLKQGRLTTLQVYDIQGRSVQSVDPRLLWSNLTAQTGYFNFRYLYSMTGESLKTESADAGQRIQLANLFSAPVHLWDARGFHTETVYDQLQRNVQTTVSGGDGTDTAPRVAGAIVYGEYAPDAAANNMTGQPWKVFDDAGAAVMGTYGIASQALEQQRYFRTDYKTGTDWTETAQADVLKEAPFEQFTDHNALGLPIRSISPDGSVYLPAYNIGGQLVQLDLLFAGDVNKTTPAPVTIFQQAVYDPNGQLIALTYGNGTALRHTFEATTQQLLNQRSYRINTPQGSGDPRLQEIHYTYDPEGNVTARRDNSWENVFTQNQMVEPLSQYAYNLIYQLIGASGRQLKLQGGGAAGGERKFMLEHSIPLKWTSPNNTQALENYKEAYRYDDAGNLVQSRHSASKQWTWAYTVAEECNQLLTDGQKKVSYDASGNLQTLSNLSSITWNYRNELTQAVVIAREHTTPDAEYYQYDWGGNRMRKVTERLLYGDTQKEIEEKYYISGYQYTRITHVAVNGGSTQQAVVLLEKQMLKISGPNGLCCISNYWLTDTWGRETKAMLRTFRYQYGDMLGSVGLEADDKGLLLSYEEYYPYGGTAFSVSANALEVSLKVYRFSGQEKDGFTGLYYYGMRYYPPWLCRWINPDPAGTIDGLNLYAFVGGNPVTYYDVGGTDKWGHRKRRKKTYGRGSAASRGKKKVVKKTGVPASTFKYFTKDVVRPSTDYELKDRAYDLGKRVAMEVEGKVGGKDLATLKDEIIKTGNGRELLFEINEKEQDVAKFNFSFAFAMQGKQSKFEGTYRAAQRGQDEFVSTAMVSTFLRAVKETTTDKDARKQIKDAIQFISLYRMPTEGMGTQTKDDFVQHSSSDRSFYGKTNADGSASWGEPTHLDRKRSEKALTAGESSTVAGIERLVAMAQAALLYSVTSGFCGRPTATNVKCNASITDAQKLAQNKLREAGKAQLPITATNDNPSKGASAPQDAVYNFDYDGYNCPSPSITYT